MVSIPMTSKKPVSTSELDQINRITGKAQSTQTLLIPTRPAARQEPPSAPSQPASRPAPKRPHPPAAGVMLQKGQKTSLSQLKPDLDVVKVGLGWELGPNGQGYDLDVEAFLLNSSGKVPGDDWFVFYNQPVSPDGAVRLLETGTSSTSPGDDAAVQVQLRRLDPQVNKIVFIVTINEARVHGYNFSNVSQAYVRIVDQASSRELVRFQLTDYYSNVCSMMAAELYRYKDEWRFNPVGNGTGDDLAGLCTRYGVNV